MSKRRARVRWFERRLALWWEHREAIGACEERLRSLQERVDRARDLSEAAERACAEARGAVAAWKEAAAAVERQGKRVLGEIREAAAVDPEVWRLAGIKGAPRCDEGEALPPGPPRIVELAAMQTGVRVRWEAAAGEAKMSAGTMYVLERRAGDQVGFRLLGATSALEYHDTDIPGESRSVAYRVLAQRAGMISAYSEIALLRLLGGAGGNDGTIPLAA